VGVQSAVGVAANDVGERAAAIDPEIPLAGIRHALSCLPFGYAGHSAVMIGELLYRRQIMRKGAGPRGKDCPMLKFALPFIAYAIFEIAALAPAPAIAGEVLAGSEWGIEGQDKPFIQFGSEGRVAGNSGCNRFTGAYETAEDGAIKIGPLASTRMACPEPDMAAEAKFLAMLDQVRKFERDGTKLALRGEDGALLAQFAQRDAD
jgi:heat shock protein HslJ